MKPEERDSLAKWYSELPFETQINIFLSFYELLWEAEWVGHYVEDDPDGVRVYWAHSGEPLTDGPGS
jgi:hypothetical protein